MYLLLVHIITAVQDYFL